MDVSEWLRGLGLDQYTLAFRENKITPDLLPSLTVEDLKELGVGLVGDRRRLLNAIATLAPASAAAEPGPPPLKPITRQEVERRQVTILFCDLVGSTALSAQLDPEDLRGVIGTYHRCCGGVIEAAGGFVAKYMGDGMLAYFGYPRADEHAAELSVRAALRLIEAVGQLETAASLPLRARFGIATGLVVVGDLIGEGAAQEQAVVGETPNRAARLQELAAPNGVVIDATTRQQIGALFECRDLGPVDLKGLPKPVQVWTVQSESAVESRFEALRAPRIAPLIGRADELELLIRCWQKAQIGEGQVVLVSGEAGIGKSRLTAALHDRIRGEPHLWISYFCSPHHQESALHPIISQFQRAAGFQRTDTDEGRWAKLEALLAPTALPEADVALLGDLLSLSGRDVPELGEISPELRRRRTTDALLRRVAALARQRSIVAVFEDVHWADPSSCDLLDRLISEITNQAVLLVLTFRPEFQAPWAGLAHITSLLLNRLDRRESTALVRGIARPDRPMPADIVDEIASRTDGVPLFLEELTRAALEADAALSSIPDVASSASLASARVPASLHASLMARLDRLGPDARAVAQIGAVIGREFEYELLAAVAGRGEPELHRALDRLTEAGLVLRRGTAPAASFLFKHALVQDVAYGMLLRARRQQLHAGIGRALADQFPEQRESQPQLVAHHLTEAGRAEEAVGFWLLAGRRSVERSANREAVGQLKRGLDLLMTLPASAVHDRLELAFQLALGAPLQHLHSLASPQVVAAYERAATLCDRLGDVEGLIFTLHGLRAHMMIAGEARTSLRLASQCLTAAERHTGRDYRLLGHYGLGAASMYLGDLLKARSELERVVVLYDPERDRSLTARCSVDPLATAQGFLSLVLWALGYPEQARLSRDTAFQSEIEQKHVHTSAHVRFYAGAQLAELFRDVTAAENHANAVIAIADQHGLPSWRAHATVLLGWVLGQIGRVADAIPLVQQGLASFDATGAVGHRIHYVAVVAELHARLGDHSKSLRLIEDVHRQVQQTEYHFWHAELCRIEGEVRHQSGAPDVQVESCFTNAIEWAKQQQAKSFELRAAMSLARLWRDQGRLKDARDLLMPIYEWFTEGFDTPDLRDAKTLLDELQGAGSGLQ
jgi:class 3 adenylate cyclase/predicted ATPase